MLFFTPIMRFMTYCTYFITKYFPHYIKASKKDREEKKGKGRLVCVGGRICSIPCRARRFAPVDLKK